jgi:hypothetical protein
VIGQLSISFKLYYGFLSAFKRGYIFFSETLKSKKKKIMINLFSYLIFGFSLWYGMFLFSSIFTHSIRVYIVRALLNEILIYAVVIFFLHFIIDTHFNVIHCDDKEIIVTIKGVEITGLTWIASQFGNGAAFVVGAKIAQAAIAKKSLGVVPKIAIPLAGGASATTIYAGTTGTINILMNRLGNNEVKVTVDEGSLKALLKDADVKSNLGFSDPKVLKELIEKTRTEEVGFNRQRIAHKLKENDAYDDNAAAWLDTELKNMSTESGSGCIISSPLESIPQLDDLLLILNSSLKLNLIIL